MRAVNRVAGLVLGIALLALGLLTVVETIAMTVWNRAWPLPVLRWRDDLARIQWSDRSVLVTSIVVLAVGLLLCGLQALRVRPAHLRTSLATDDDGWVVRRRSVEQQAANAVRGIRGVDGAKATARGKQDHWQLAVIASAPGGVVEPDDVRQVVQAELAHLGAPSDTPVRVTVRGRASQA